MSWDLNRPCAHIKILKRDSGFYHCSICGEKFELLSLRRSLRVGELDPTDGVHDLFVELNMNYAKLEGSELVQKIVELLSSITIYLLVDVRDDRITVHYQYNEDEPIFIGEVFTGTDGTYQMPQVMIRA